MSTAASAKGASNRQGAREHGHGVTRLGCHHRQSLGNVLRLGGLRAR